MAAILIPKGYNVENPVAETFDQYKKVTSTVYLDREQGLYLIKVKDHIKDDTKLFGPFDMRCLETTQHVIEDVLWKAGKRS